MRRLCTVVAVLSLAGGAAASWYWPFGSSDDGSEPVRRLSELMEPASRLIDEASDLAADGKTQESVEKYREALGELDRIEEENPDRAASAEFATLRNKRAYVNAAIDSLLLGQVRENAKAVAVSDTTELEKRLAAEKAKARGEKTDPDKAEAGDGDGKKAEGEVTPAPDDEEEAPAEDAELPAEAPAAPAAKEAPEREAPAAPAAKPLSRREQAIADIAAKNFESAEALIEEMLAEKPNGAMALNLRASMEAAQGKLKEAELTLDQAIMSNPRSHYAYYNMASLLLQADPENKAAAKRYYETGRAVGGPPDEQLEAALR